MALSVAVVHSSTRPLATLVAYPLAPPNAPETTAETAAVSCGEKTAQTSATQATPRSAIITQSPP